MPHDTEEAPPPLLSVVVPVYDVADYVAECLQSITTQSFRDLEVVVVDDGSTDGSAAIVERLAAADPRIRLIRQTNHGLGHARNTGVRNASGRYLTFVDSDDVIPPYAYRLMVRTIERSGSDFVTGNVQRFSSAGVKQSGLHAAFTHDQLATHVTKVPGLLRDRLAPNKLWRRSFWDEHGLAFPEGVLYEDIPVTIPAHFLARSVDVLHQPVYLWRIREGESRSITQDRTHLRGLEDRFAAIGAVKQFLRTSHPDAVDQFDRVALSSDVKIFINPLGRADEEFRARFLELTNEYLADVADAVLDGLPALERVQYALVRQGRVEDLIVANRFARYEKADHMLTRVGDRYLIDHPARGTVGLGDELFDMTDELGLRSRIDDARWRTGRDGRSYLDVTGWAYVEGVSFSEPTDGVLTARLVNGRDDTRISLVVEQRKRFEAAIDAPESAADVGGSGFRLVIPVDPLVQASGSMHRRFGSVDWRVELELAVGGLARRASLARPTPGPAGRPGPHDSGDVRVQPRYDRRGEMLVGVVSLGAVVDQVRLVDDELQVSGSWLSRWPVRRATLRVRRRVGTDRFRYPAAVGWWARRFTATVDLSDLTRALDSGHGPTRRAYDSGGVIWDVDLVLDRVGRRSRGVRLDVSTFMSELVAKVGTSEISVRRGRNGRLTLDERQPTPYVDEAELADGVLMLGGRFTGAPDADVDLVLVPRSGESALHVPMTRSAGGFVVSADLAAEPRLEQDTYDLAAVVREPDASLRRTAVVVAQDLLAALPLGDEIGGAGVELVDTAKGQLMLRVHSRLPLPERSAFAQRRFAETFYPSARDSSLVDQVLIDSTRAAQSADDAWQVAEQLVSADLGVPVVWTVSDRSRGATQPVSGCRQLVRGSQAWYSALAVSRVVLTDGPMPEFFVRRAGQSVVDLGSAAPLGRSVTDLVGRPLDAAPPAPRDPGWSHVLSPGPWATGPIRQRVGPEVAVVHTGRPRSDALVGGSAPGLADRARAARRALRLPADGPVVLVAPVWSGEHLDAANRPRLDPDLDLTEVGAAARRGLGEAANVLLLRERGVIPAAASRADDRAVHDVTGWPATSELVLAADVLVTDGSPLTFDFVALGRPVVTAPLDGTEVVHGRMRPTSIGHILGGSTDGPGPTAASLGELADVLAVLDRSTSGEPTAFGARYCPLDDGRAGQRVVELVQRLLDARSGER